MESKIFENNVMYRKQFILLQDKNFPFKWNKVEIGRYNLFYHPELEYASTTTNNSKIHLLGSLYDYEFIELSNKQIIDKLSHTDTLEKLFSSISKYFGEYILIYEQNDKIILFNDTCSQAEVYYDDSFSCFATQPKLISEVINLISHSDPDAIDFYTSDVFRKKCLFVGESTHVKNIKHLLPNHYIDIENQKVRRFFPEQLLPEQPLDYVAQRASMMIKGYVKAISLRHKMAIAVTGGYDSRVLFLASLGTDSKYYVIKHSYMTDKHHDIAISKQLTFLFNKKLYVLDGKIKSRNDYSQEYIDSINFPRFLNRLGSEFKDYVFINGNIAEIARNYFGYHKNISPEDLSFLIGYSLHNFPSRQYNLYLKSKVRFENLGYNLLDMFYWEEKMGNWAAKAKTEANALGKMIVSPFNSRDLLTLLLSTNRKYRDSHQNRLFDRIIFYLSEGEKDVIKLPVNPCRKQRIIKTMKTLHIYNLYKEIGLRTRTF